MTTEGDKRKLVDLRVVDLRAELEKRGLESKGVKATLIERLQKVLSDEGHDPEEYLFEIEAAKVPKRSSMKRGEQDTESETQSNADENHDTSMEVDEDGKEKEDEDDDEKIENGKEKETKSSEKSVKQEEKKDVNSGSQSLGTSGNSSENTENNPEGSSGLASANQGADGDKSVPEANGVDNEDSINLTIGEDEEKLLADEVGHEEDSSSQEKDAKDEGERGGVNPEEGTAGGDGKKQAAGQQEDKDIAVEDGKQAKAQEENKDDKGGDKGKSSAANADQKLSKDDKDKRAKLTTAAGSSRNLWVSGLSSSTRATDLKQVFSKYGKVIGAKVVTNARTPGARCYGYVTMATSEDASKCIQHLHRTELHGRMISVERAKGDAAGPPKKGAEGRAVAAKKIEEKKRHERKLSTSSKTEEKKTDKEEKSESGKTEAGKIDGAKDVEETTEEPKDKEGAKEDDEKEKEGSEPEKEAGEGRSIDKSHSREVSHEHRERHRSAGSSHYSHHSRPQSRSPHHRVFRPGSPGRRPGVLTFTQIREERERQRLRERERELREEDRRRREEMARQREIERRQREEAVRLEREKERLRVERERIESERAELMRLERERQRLEREKLEREREELKRQQLRFEEARRTTKRPTDDRRDSYPEERKRVATESRYEGSRPRFEDNARTNEFPAKKEYKHGGDFAARRSAGSKFEGSNYDQDTRTSRAEGIPMKKDPSHELPRRDHPVQEVVRAKDSRFECGGPSFRVRDERRAEGDHRPKVEMRHSARDRYADSAEGEGRYSERSGDSWHAGGGPPPVKPFSSLSGGGVPSRDSWGASADRKSDGGQNWGRPIESGSSDRWVSGGTGPMGVGRSGPGMGGPGSMYGSQPNVPPNAPGMNMGMSNSGPYGADRFDSYKQSMGPIRKY